MGCALEKSIIKTINCNDELRGTESAYLKNRAKEPVWAVGKMKGKRHGGRKPQDSEDIRDKYTIGMVLGSGSFGQVREATLRSPSSPSSAKRAVKIVTRDGQEGEWSNADMFKTEVVLLQNIDDPNIVKCFDFYEDPSFLYVVMERCEGGEVFQKIRELRRFGEYDAAAIGKQMLSALLYIHRIHIAHRDIKAENFLFWANDMTSPLKMIDFGMAAIVKPGQYLDALCGSPHYLSPELVGQKYNEITDIWAFGVLMYLMLYGRYPHAGKLPEEIMWQILTADICWKSEGVKISRTAISFLKHLLEPNWHKRYSAEMALKHAWINSYKDRKQHPGAPPMADVPQEIRQAAHNASKIRFTAPIIPVNNFEQKLEQINLDYSRGTRIGKRLSGGPKSRELSLEKLQQTDRNQAKSRLPKDLLMNSLVDRKADDARVGGPLYLGKSCSLRLHKTSLDTVIPEEEFLSSQTRHEQMAMLATECSALDQGKAKPTNRSIMVGIGRPKPLARGQHNPHNRFQVRAVSTPHMAYIGVLDAEKTSSFAKKYDQIFGVAHFSRDKIEKCIVPVEETDTKEECVAFPDGGIRESDSNVAGKLDDDEADKNADEVGAHPSETRLIGEVDAHD
eukprot:GEMP01005780.1.p1 GENE.GEMP01005780.1~~GEMP01005780.1.p1  ORF type:complete len:620 (+),score=111.34 GEMP01005780.1:213-2072(+)